MSKDKPRRPTRSRILSIKRQARKRFKRQQHRRVKRQTRRLRRTDEFIRAADHAGPPTD